MPDTDAQESAGPSGSNNGPGENIELQTVNPRPARSDDVGSDVEPSGGSRELDRQAAREAANSAVMKRLGKIRTHMLQDDGLVHKAMTEMDAIFTDESPLAPLFSGADLVEMANEIVVTRKKAEKKFRAKLQEKFLQLHGDVWKSKISPQGSNNGIYEQWLDTDAPFTKHSAINPDDWFLSAPLSTNLINAKYAWRSIYDIDFSMAGNCAALVVADMSLHIMCELGAHFDLEPQFLIDHYCSPLSPKHRARSSEDHDNSDRYEKIAKFHLLGRAVETSRSKTKSDSDIINLVFNTIPSRNVRNTEESIDPKHESCLSCLRIRHSLFVIALRVGATTTSVAPAVAPAGAIILPCLRESPQQGKKVLTIASLVGKEIESMFSDVQRTGRLSEFLPSSLGSDFASVLLWQLAVWMYDRQLQKVTLDLQELSFESVTILPSKALNRIKNGRARVAGLRKTLASTKEGVLKHDKQTIVHEAVSSTTQDDPKGKGKSNDSPVQEFNDMSLMRRQMASSSVDDEYTWLDRQAADLMPPLNENLQLVIATISLEQSNAALEDMDTSRRNGERATLLTLLAAFYLPLSLVTGIFGMNIQEISGENKGPKWRPVAAIAGSLLGVSLILMTIFWLWPKRHHRTDLQHQIEAQDGGKEQKEKAWFWQRFGDRKSPSGGDDGAKGKGWSWSDLASVKRKDKNS